MAFIFESELELWGVLFLLLAGIFPAVFITLIIKADKPPKVDLEQVLKDEESSASTVS
jgi:hypothetical protein